MTENIEKRKDKSYRKHAPLIIAVILLFIAIAVALTSIGKYIIGPFETSTNWDNPNCAAFNEDGQLGAVVDMKAKRLSVINAQGKISTQNFIRDNVMPIKNILNACIYDNSIYLHGVEMNENSTIIEDEKIVRCSFMGEYKETIFSLKDLEPNLDKTKNHITNIKFYDNNLYISLKDSHNTWAYCGDIDTDENYYFKKIDQVSSDYYIFDSEYFPQTNKFVINNYVDKYFEIDAESNQQIATNNYNFNSNLTTDKIGTGAEYSLFYYLKIISRWIAYLYIGIFFIISLIIFFKSQRKQLRKGFIKKSVLIAVVFVTIIGVSAFYNSILYEQMELNAVDNLEAMADISANEVDAQTVKDIDYLNSFLRSRTYESDFINTFDKLYSVLNKVPEKIEKSTSKSDKAVIYCVYTYDPISDKCLLLGDSHNNIKIMRSEDYLPEAMVEAFTNKDVYSGIDEDYYGSYIYSSKAFYNQNNEAVGFYLFGVYTKAIDNAFYNDIGILTFILIAACLIIYALIRELENISICIRKYLKKRKNRSQRAYLQLIRPLSFFLSLAMGADAAIAILISKELFNTSSFFSKVNALSLSDLFISVPLIVAGFGLVFGIIVFSILEKKFSSKNIFRWCSILLIVSFGFMILSCLNESFLLFTLFKLFTGLFIGILRAELYSLAISEKTEKKSHPLVSSIGRTGMPASVIAAVVSGWMSLTIGNYSVYIFALLSIVVYFVLGSLFIPKGVYFIKYEKNKQTKEGTVTLHKKLSKKDILKWVFSPQILVLILFVIVPYTAAGGYKSYLFPLYSQGLGFDKTEISILYSLATAAAFIVVHPISTLYNGIDNRNRIIMGLFLLGFVFILFLFNSRIVWAVIVMALSMVCMRVFGTSFRMSWVRHCEYYNLDRAQLQPVMYFIEEFFKAMQVVFFAIFFMIGSNYACVVFGIFCIIGATIFATVTHNSPMRRKWRNAH